MSRMFQFDCIFYYVLDLDRAIRFYTEILGLHLSSRDVVARLDIDGILLELVPTTETSLVAGTGNARLALRVDNITAVAATLRSKAVEVSPIKVVENGSLATLRDPDGNEILLWQYQ